MNLPSMCELSFHKIDIEIRQLINVGEEQLFCTILIRNKIVHVALSFSELHLVHSLFFVVLIIHYHRLKDHED